MGRPGAAMLLAAVTVACAASPEPPATRPAAPSARSTASRGDGGPRWSCLVLEGSDRDARCYSQLRCESLRGKVPAGRASAETPVCRTYETAWCRADCSVDRECVWDCAVTEQACRGATGQPCELTAAPEHPGVPPGVGWYCYSSENLARRDGHSSTCRRQRDSCEYFRQDTVDKLNHRGERIVATLCAPQARAACLTATLKLEPDWVAWCSASLADCQRQADYWHAIPAKDAAVGECFWAR